MKAPIPTKAKIRKMAKKSGVLRPGEKLYEAVITMRWISTGSFNEEYRAICQTTVPFKRESRLAGKIDLEIIFDQEHDG